MFFTLVDELNANPKFKRLLERNLVDDATGAVAVTLWTMAGAASRESLSDGVITRADAIRIMLNHEWAELGARTLVDVGLWHDARTEHDCDTCMQHLAECTLCRPLGPGEYRFHDWWQRKYDHGAQSKLTIAKKRELQDKKLRAQVWARDSNPGDIETAPCRYCGDPMRRQDRKSSKRPEMDHVDPWLACGASNLVMGCWECNHRKGQRTPEDAGMTLRPAPVKTSQAVRQDSEDSRPLRAAGSPQVRRADSPLADAGSAITVAVTPEPTVAPSAAPKPHPPGRHPGADQSAPDPLIEPSIRGAELSSYARTGVGGPGGSSPGTGAGSGAGRGEGSGRGRRRRRRGRGRGAKQEHAAGSGARVLGRAGAVAPVDPMKEPAREGSPFRGYHGPWVDRDEQSVCERHGCDRPCSRCEEERR